MRGKTLEQLVAEAQAQIGHTSAEALQTAIDNNEPIVILDVRDKELYDAEHLPGAISLPRAAIELEIDELVPDQDHTHCCTLWRQHPWLTVRTHFTDYGIQERFCTDRWIPRLAGGGSTDRKRD